MSELVEQHHRYSASGAEGWFNCPGKIAMEQGKEEKYSPYADEGSAAHFLAAECLIGLVDADEHIGKTIVCYTYEGRAYQAFSFTPIPENSVLSSEWEVTRDMARYVQTYIDQVSEAAKDGTLLVEQRVRFGDYIGDPGAFGTGDAIIVSNDGKTLKVRDLKYGFKPVSPVENMQMMLYALGALFEFDYLIDLGELENIDLQILQPRTSTQDPPWITTPARLFEFAEEAKAAVAKAEEAIAKLNDHDWMSDNPGTFDEWAGMYLRPSEKGCTWCKAKAACPALQNECLSDMQIAPATADGLTNLDAEMDAALLRITEVDFETLVKLYGVTKKIKMWAEGIEDRMMHDMLNGHKTPHYKIVRGRQGNRKWTSEQDAEAALKRMKFKVDEMYDKSVISVPTAEKLIRAQSPKKWRQLEELITRPEGKLVVAPMGDKRESFDPYGEQIAKLPDYSNVTLDDLI
jgi:hypothetical protein